MLAGGQSLYGGDVLGVVRQRYRAQRSLELQPLSKVAVIILAVVAHGRWAAGRVHFVAGQLDGTGTVPGT